MKNWLVAARLRTLPLAVAGILLGAIPLETGPSAGLIPISLCIITAILLQVLSNFANDLGDTQNGADLHRTIGPARAVQSGAISVSSMKRAVGITASMAIVSGLALIWLTLWQEGWRLSFFLFLLMGLSGVAAAYFYTAGKRPYGYSAGGDGAVFIFFGGVAVMGAHFLLYHAFHWGTFYLAVMQGMLSVMVLHLNNMRDLEDDKRSRKTTVAILLGWKWSKIYLACMLLLSAGSLCLFVAESKQWKNVSALLLWLVLTGVFIRVVKAKDGQDVDKELKKVALSAFIVSLLLFLLS